MHSTFAEKIVTLLSYPARTAPLLNHIWQSTAVFLAVWLLAWSLHAAQAKVRYRLWLAASLKFLLPFSLFVAAGERMRTAWGSAAQHPALASAIGRVTTPFPPQQRLGAILLHADPMSAAAHVCNDVVLWILAAVWLCGACIVLLTGLREWMCIRAILCSAAQMAQVSGIPILSHAGSLEPGVAGIFRPVILLPETIMSRLSQAQIESILAHELCHICRRDNLTAALHMLVTAAFWFHPAVWMIRTRLLEEREHACDEAVLLSGSNPETYAESILSVCRFSVESPLACMSRVTGADLKLRIVRIMAGGNARSLSRGNKVALLFAAILAMTFALAPGLLGDPRHGGLAQTIPEGTHLPSFEVASIRPVPPNQQGFTSISPYGQPRFTAKNVSMTSLLELAYNVDDRYIKGMPKGEDATLFDIDAKTEGDVPLTYERLQPLMQHLLQQRFHLAAHRETEEISGYDLIVAKTGLKLKTTDQPPKRSYILPDEIHMPSGSMEIFARVLARVLHRPIQDVTQTPGNYEIQLKYAPEDATDSALPSVYTALKEQLGLELKPSKVAVAMLVVDHVDAMPTEN